MIIEKEKVTFCDDGLELELPRFIKCDCGGKAEYYNGFIVSNQSGQNYKCIKCKQTITTMAHVGMIKKCEMTEKI